MRIPNYYENPHILHENTLPHRCYYIPASEMMSVLVRDRETSDRFHTLNGEWHFRYYDSLYTLRDEFYASDYDASQMNTITVPSVWQMAGYDSHQYTNIRYPFPFDPPYVPADNPCGTYIRDFEYHKCEEAPKSYLVFEGVDSCFYVWINGRYVGYSQVSHATSEFDVSDVLEEGVNRIAVLVLKWCDGSYLEDQDKFRMSGIFRDVYLLDRPEDAIFDYFITTDYMDNRAEVYLQMTYFRTVTPTKIRLFDQNGKVLNESRVEARDENTAQAHIVIDEPILWNAENPYLYTLVLEVDNEIITERIGVRTICIRDKVLLFNEQPLVFKGVNRHDSDPVTGATISIEQMEKDLKMMKRHNFNAIRSSHYPNAPFFYQLCDEYGFYVMGEADNESHGPAEIYYKDNTVANKESRWNETIADNADFEEAILDRVQSCVQREKNRPCIVVWSMGNECAYGCAFEKALKWTKEFDSRRLTQYESARYHGNRREYDFSNLDLYSRMYPSFEEIKEYLSNDPQKPFLLIEYSHAMGNGPGDLEEYFQLFHKEPLMCGGFVWEWCDHAIAQGEQRNGREVYYYGGDHGEEIHDNNFCVDGLVYPDRRPHTGLLEYKNVYRPLRVVSYNQGTSMISFWNYMDFSNAKDCIKMKYEVNCDGEIVDQGVLNTPFIAPRQVGIAKLPLFIPDKGRTYLKIYYYTAQNMPMIPEEYLLGFDEVLLHNQDNAHQAVAQREQYLLSKQMNDIRVEETQGVIILEGENFRYTLDKRTGLFVQLIYCEQELLKKPMNLNIWRAPADNDLYIKSEWQRARYNKTFSRVYEAKIVQERGGVVIRCHVAMLAETVQKILDLDIVWTIKNDGTVRANLKVTKQPEFPRLPRFGLRMFLEDSFEMVEYYGMGPMESYCDKHRAASHGVYRAQVSELHEDYIKPQENGSHYDCSYVELSNQEYALMAFSRVPFSFNASVYTQEELTEKKHNFELQPSGNVVLCLDYAQSGMGSNSCGPDLSEKYQLNMEKFEFEINLQPSKKRNLAE